MRRKLSIFLSGFIGIVVIAFIIAGNYFYSQGIKRGTEIEIHREAASVNIEAGGEDQALFFEAEEWYEARQPEILKMSSYDDLTLQAKFIEHEEPTKQAVILAHGFRNTGDDMGKLAKLYYDEGFHILLPDARGHGESEGDYIGYGWHDRLDYRDWIHLLIDTYGMERILLHGNSMGAATVLMMSGEDLPPEVKGIIADSGYSTVKEELAHQLKHIYGLPSFPLLEVTSLITKIRAGYTFEEASALKQVAKNQVPLFIIHGDQDDLVPTKMAYDIYEKAKGEKELWIVPDVGHTKAFDVYTKEFQSRVKEFISRLFRDIEG